MLHSPRIMQSMLERRPDEENGEQAAPVEAAKPQAANAEQPQQSAPSEPAYTPEIPPYVDHAQAALRVAPISEELKADLWDLYHLGSKDSADLAEKLRNVDAPNDVKHILHSLKMISDRPANWESRLQKVVDIINTKLPALHKSDRTGKSPVTISEKHPRVFQALLDATKKDEE